MKTVGIKTLKNKLSHYIQLVRQGELVLVSDRDEVVAEIRKPLRVWKPGVSRFEAFVEEAALRGAIKKPQVCPLFPSKRSDLPKSPINVPAMKLLDESREERSLW